MKLKWKWKHCFAGVSILFAIQLKYSFGAKDEAQFKIHFSSDKLYDVRPDKMPLNKPVHMNYGSLKIGISSDFDLIKWVMNVYLAFARRLVVTRCHLLDSIQFVQFSFFFLATFHMSFMIK